ncbi:MAG TPA: biopolymer transporter Tol [Pirellulales bacterium]|nr:biopolymer transporter Tol [Pirellulales bacterium]
MHRTDSHFQSRFLWRVVAGIGIFIWLGSSASADEGTREKPSIESRYLSNIRQVTSGFIKAGEGYFSPDGHTIIFQAVPQEYPFYQIYTQSLAGGKPKRVSTGRGKTTCSFFSPDGTGIIYASSHLDPDLDRTEDAGRKQQAEDAKSGAHRRYQWDFDPNMEIFAGDLDGKNIRRLTFSKGYDAECSYSADGKQIVFCSNRGGNPNIYIMNADGSGVRQLTHEKGYNGGPFFSLDGKWVVYRSDRKHEGLLQIHVIRADGSGDTALTDNGGVNWAPYWHPSKSYLIWTAADYSNPRGKPNFDLWLMKYEHRDGQIMPGPITQITDHPAADVLPVFSPDGKQLMWTSNRTADNSSQLFIADFKLPE